MERRSFIKGLGLGAGALAAAPVFAGAKKVTADEPRKARIALIGCGSRGQYHLHSIREIAGAEVIALCDVYRPHLEAAAALCPGAELYSDYRKVLERGDIDGIIVATPLGLHAQITLDGLSAGKNVFCEKSMALTLEQCKAVYQASLASDKALYYCMQRRFDPKYVQGVRKIHEGLIGDVVGMRCHWFRNADWRREVPSPEYERLINWRLYKESSAGLMTELACHQMEVCNWVTGIMPSEITGFGDIVYWKDGREVYDSVSLVYRYSDGRKLTYESLISNKFNGMEEQILGKDGTADLSRGVYYLEEDNLVPGIKRLAQQIADKTFGAIPTAGPSWRPELKSAYAPHPIMEDKITINPGQDTTGIADDGSVDILRAFCEACITGKKAPEIVEDAYCASVLCLLGNLAMESGRVVSFPSEYKIPCMKF